MKKTPPENTGRVIALALGFFGSLALVGWSAGVFARLGPETLVALALFALGVAALTYAVDDSVRGWAKAIGRMRSQVKTTPAKSPGRRPAAT